MPNARTQGSSHLLRGRPVLRRPQAPTLPPATASMVSTSAASLPPTISPRTSTSSKRELGRRNKSTPTEAQARPARAPVRPDGLGFAKAVSGCRRPGGRAPRREGEAPSTGESTGAPRVASCWQAQEPGREWRANAGGCRRPGGRAARREGEPPSTGESTGALRVATSWQGGSGGRTPGAGSGRRRSLEPQGGLGARGGRAGMPRRAQANESALVDGGSIQRGRPSVPAPGGLPPAREWAHGGRSNENGSGRAGGRCPAHLTSTSVGV